LNKAFSAHACYCELSPKPQIIRFNTLIPEFALALAEPETAT